MIRRDDGDDWLMISQVEHARLAAELAEVWQHRGPALRGVSDLLIEAVREHDDGWREWETAPTVDPETGKPRNFTEMPMPVATEIWRRGIRHCARNDPLSGIWVSRHFCFLAEQGMVGRKDNAEDVTALKGFLTEQHGLQQQFRTGSEQHFTAKEVESLSRFGCSFLKFFDRLSLWLCCAPRSKRQQFTFPIAGSVRFTPHVPTEIVADPWPFVREPVRFTVTARRIAATSFSDDNALQSALRVAKSEELRWTFFAASM